MEGLSPKVVSLARELCAAEGWEPDEVIPFDDAVGTDGPRWRLYAGAAARMVEREDAWETF